MTPHNAYKTLSQDEINTLKEIINNNKS